MKKIFIFSVIALLVMGATAFASSEIQSGDNAVILGPHMGPVGKTPPTLVQKVFVTDSTMISGAYGATGAEGSPQGGRVGDVLVWDLAKADGYCVKYLSQDWSVTAGGANTYVAGVLVTPVSRDTGSLSSPSGTSSNVGYMAVKGFTQAQIDVSKSNPGEVLIPNGSTLARSLSTARTSGTAGKQLSQDIGVLLKKSTADSIYPVVLR